jgi:hypothetical protein
MKISEWRCDDCRQRFPGEPYYTFEESGCLLVVVEMDGEEVETDHDCTGALCPQCAGVLLEPDQADDPRRPVIDYYDFNLHVFLESRQRDLS